MTARHSQNQWIWNSIPWKINHNSLGWLKLSNNYYWNFWAEGSQIFTFLPCSYSQYLQFLKVCRIHRLVKFTKKKSKKKRKIKKRNLKNNFKKIKNKDSKKKKEKKNSKYKELGMDDPTLRLQPISAEAACWRLVVWCWAVIGRCWAAQCCWAGKARSGDRRAWRAGAASRWRQPERCPRGDTWRSGRRSSPAGGAVLLLDKTKDNLHYDKIIVLSQIITSRRRCLAPTQNIAQNPIWPLHYDTIKVLSQLFHTQY